MENNDIKALIGKTDEINQTLKGYTGEVKQKLGNRITFKVFLWTMFCINIMVVFIFFYFVFTLGIIDKKYNQDLSEIRSSIGNIESILQIANE